MFTVLPPAALEPKLPCGVSLGPLGLNSMINSLSVLPRWLLWPISRLSEAIELRRLNRRFPSAHRRLVSEGHEMRRETDTEYLKRLRQIAEERTGDTTRRSPSAPSRADLADHQLP